MRRLKGFFVSFVLTALLLVVVAFVLYQTKTSMEHIGGAILLVYAVAAFVGGMIFSAQKDSRHYLMGGLFGLAIFWGCLWRQCCLEQKFIHNVPGDIDNTFGLCSCRYAWWDAWTEKK